jgi:hypothetical protein
VSPPHPPARVPRARKLLGSPFFQRYGVNLPSSLTEGPSFTLGVFPLPTSVGLRYGRSTPWLEAFLGGLGPEDFRGGLPPLGPALMAHGIGICLDPPLGAGRPACPVAGFSFPTASPLRSLTVGCGAGI